MHDLNIYKVVFLTCCALSLLPACRKDSEPFEPYSNGQEEITELLKSVPSPTANTALSFAGFELVQDRNIVLSNGVRVLLEDNDHLFELEDGTPQPCSSCSKVDIEINAALSIGDWIGYRLPATDSNGNLQDHAGAVNLNVRCDGKNVRLKQGRSIKIYIPSLLTANNFQASYTQQVPSFWEPGTANTAFHANWNNPATNTEYMGQEILAKKLGWTTAIRALSPNGWQSFSVNIPLQFDANNTRVYALLNDGRLAVEMKPVGEGGEFVLDAIPDNSVVRIITLSATGGQFWLGDASTVVASDNKTVSFSPQINDAQSITDLLQSL